MSLGSYCYHVDQGFSTLALLTFWVRQFFVGKSCAVHYRISSVIYSLDFSKILFPIVPKMFLNIAKYTFGGKTTLSGEPLREMIKIYTRTEERENGEVMKLGVILKKYSMRLMTRYTNLKRKTNFKLLSILLTKKLLTFKVLYICIFIFYAFLQMVSFTQISL